MTSPKLLLASEGWIPLFVEKQQKSGLVQSQGKKCHRSTPWMTDTREELMPSYSWDFIAMAAPTEVQAGSLVPSQPGEQETDSLLDRPENE